VYKSGNGIQEPSVYGALRGVSRVQAGLGTVGKRRAAGLSEKRGWGG